MHAHPKAVKTPREKTIILVGNPNVGKSVFFSYLTGRYATVSNFPGTTVEVSRGRSRYDAGSVVIDTPGANSMHPQSVDEKVTRNILVSSRPNLVLQIADAKNLRRGLTITTQLAEMGFPVVLAVNMMDEAARKGIKISAEALSEKIGIPVVETVAIEKRGFKKLIYSLSGPPVVPTIQVSYPKEIEESIEEISSLLPELTISKRSAAIMFLCNPDDSVGSLGSLVGKEKAAKAATIARRVQEVYSNPLSYIIGVSRSRVVDRLLDTVFLHDIRALGAEGAARIKRRQAYSALIFTVASFLLYALLGIERLSQWGLHPTLLHLVLLMCLLCVLPYRSLEKITTHYIIGTFFLLEILYLMYKFVGVFGAGTLVNLTEYNLFQEHLLPALNRFVDSAVPGAFVRDMLMGEYGLISMGLTYSIAIVLPIVATFFFAFGVLEDSGYLPRLSVIADRAMRKIGLNGKAVLPMVLGLGCDTMATLTTRILDSKKERVIATLLLALGIPCSAQLGVIVAIVSQCTAAVAITVAGVIALQLLIVGALSAKLIKGERSDFIVELPPLRPPQLGNILTKTGYRIRWFLIEAVPLFLAGTLVLFILAKAGGIVLIENAAKPVVAKMLGLPIQSTYAFIIGFFRRDYGAAGLYDMFRSGMLSHNQVVVSMVVITLFVPCIANFFVMIKERSMKTAVLMVAFILPYSILVGTVLNLVFTATGIEL